MIFRKDNIDQKLEEFVAKYRLPEKKRVKLFQVVAAKMNSLQEFVPEENDLNTIMIGKDELSGSNV